MTWQYVAGALSALSERGHFVIFLIAVVVGFAFCGLIGAVLAAEKGRALAGFWLGFLFGPIGIVIALLLASRDATAEQRTPAGLRPCPFCAEMIQPAAIKCRFCNADVPAVPRAEVVPVANEQMIVGDLEDARLAARTLAARKYSEPEISYELQKWRGLSAAVADEIAREVSTNRRS